MMAKGDALSGRTSYQNRLGLECRARAPWRLFDEHDIGSGPQKRSRGGQAPGADDAFLEVRYLSKGHVRALHNMLHDGI